MGFLELTGAPRRGPGTHVINVDHLRLAAAVTGIAVTVAVLPQAHGATGSPRPTDLGCVEGCAGKQTAAHRSTVRITGSGLKHVVEVRFGARSPRVAAKPTASSRYRLMVRVPRHAVTGHLRVVDADGDATRMHELLRLVSRRALPTRGSFKLLDSDVRPKVTFVDDGHAVKLSYRFRAFAPVNVTVKLMRGDRVLRRWTDDHALPYRKHDLRWKGMLSRHREASAGHYRLKIKAPGHKPRPSGRVRILSGKFPVRGRHAYGGAEQRFGAPRSGGRVHQGQDVFSACGTRVVAARGGRVQARGSDPVLYGNWIVIDALRTRTDYRYAHFQQPASVHSGERVRTSDTVGRIGRTGNARSVGCMLHFEVWPHGWSNGRPMDPLPILKRWDGWS